MLDMQKWIREVETLSVRLRERPEVDCNSNRLRPAPNLEDLAALQSQFAQWDLKQLLNFYSHCDGADFPDLWNGYYLLPIKRILQFGDQIPSQIEGSITRSVLRFGSDGGGNLLALSLGQKPEILYLPHGRIRDSVYRESGIRIRVLAKDFYEFLERFLQDLAACVDETPGWKYIIP